MPLKNRSPLVLVIEPDSASASELAEWLAERSEAPEVMWSTSVLTAGKALRTERFDWLFIRIRCWDAVQQLALSPRRRPHRVVFLSGRREKGLALLDQALDAHLRAPYLPGPLTAIWERLWSPGYQPQPLDFFFLRVQGQLMPMRYGDLRQVIREGQLLRIKTRFGDYRFTSNLRRFQARLPIPLTPVRRGWLVNQAYQESAPTSETGNPSSFFKGQR
jgi:hypothetical protein